MHRTEKQPVGGQSGPISRPKRPPRWRELTDEEQWKRIYKGRSQRQAAAPKSIRQAVGLALPSYALHMAVSDCHATFQATVRHDVHMAIVSGVAKVSSLIPVKWRDQMSDQLELEFHTLKTKGFYLGNREFLYAVAAATVKLADDWRYPADSPACMAAIMLKEDAETDEEGDWSLTKSHALKMVGIAYNSFTETGLYADAESVIKAVD